MQIEIGINWSGSLLYDWRQARILGRREVVRAVSARAVIVARAKAEDKRKKKHPEKSIDDLKRRAEELTGGQMEIGGLDDCPAEVEEGFWKHVVEYEEAPWTTNFQQ